MRPGETITTVYVTHEQARFLALQGPGNVSAYLSGLIHVYPVREVLEALPRGRLLVPIAIRLLDSVRERAKARGLTVSMLFARRLQGAMLSAEVSKSEPRKPKLKASRQ